jgi:transposase
MFLRAKIRKKDGKLHRYWSVVENRRTHNGRVVQRDVLYLGELNDSQHAGWVRMIDGLCDEDGSRVQMALFPEDREPAVGLCCETVQVCLKDLQLRSPRQWGGCWLAMYLWGLLGLDEFWSPALPPSREGTRWLSLLKSLVAYRLIDPGSEYRFHREWYVHSAMSDLLGETFGLAAKNNPYRCMDLLVDHKERLFGFLHKRWTELFGVTHDVLLYDLTSTYFECDPPDPDEGSKKAYGYSRDHRSDCVQVVIALVITPDGFPLAYEVLQGNTNDHSTLRQFLESIKSKYGDARRTWLMDRGIPTEESLEEMREQGIGYLVGTPKGRLSGLEKKLLEQPWSKARESVRVKLIEEQIAGKENPEKLQDCEKTKTGFDAVEHPTSGQLHEVSKLKELYVLVESEQRVNKERSMRRRRLRQLWKKLNELSARKRLRRDQLLMSLGAARKQAGRAWSLVRITVPDKNEEVSKTTFSFELNRKKLREVRKREGRYLLRSNLATAEPAALWELYLKLVQVEQAFKDLKGDLRIRPIWHQEDERIEAHIFICFLAYCLHVTLRNLARNVAGGLTPDAIMKKLCSIQMIDVHLPTTDGRHIVLSRYTHPDQDLALMLAQLKLQLPPQSPPKIYSSGRVVM